MIPSMGSVGPKVDFFGKNALQQQLARIYMVSVREYLELVRKCQV